jgi:hypothetical protein
MKFQTGMNVNTNTFQTGLGYNLDIGTVSEQHMPTKLSHLKKKIAWQGE